MQKWKRKYWRSSSLLFILVFWGKVLLAFDKMDFFLFAFMGTTISSSNCFCHVYQMQINWDFLYIYFSQKHKSEPRKSREGSAQGESYGTKGQSSKMKIVYLDKFVSIHKIDERCAGDIEKLISIKSPENHFDFFRTNIDRKNFLLPNCSVVKKVLLVV